MLGPLSNVFSSLRFALFGLMLIPLSFAQMERGLPQKNQTTSDQTSLLVQPKIVGGSDAPSWRYPFTVALKYRSGKREHFCGGSLIGKEFSFCNRLSLTNLPKRLS
jgi:hypothetical protein